MVGGRINYLTVGIMGSDNPVDSSLTSYIIIQKCVYNKLVHVGGHNGITLF